ncbi:MAG: ATP-binding protein [Dehalococcoidia bacterium]|nr:ATP-binding protein [Dehalococcoidia bacterium]
MLLIAQRDRSDAVELEPIALRPLLSAITATVQKQDTSRELVLEVEPGLPPVLGNAGYIEQLVENLVTNSRKYGAKGTRIRIAAVSDGGAARVSVSDEGERLDPEEVARYFEPFYREARSAGRAQGSGLGLAVCSQLVELMGGTISARAVPTGGLEVTFTLPFLGE